MSDIENKLSNIIVIKRDGKKVEFNESKIAVAIKKGFDSVKKENSEASKYTEKDIYKVYNLVIKKIIEENKEKIKIEEIQDLIEIALRDEGYKEIYESQTKEAQESWIEIKAQ